jgi:CheY-like chemotaxis protein
MKILSLGAISVVDDDESVLTSTEALLRSIGYEVKTFASAELFLESGALRETECLVLDVQMPGIDGLELQRRLNEARSGVPPQKKKRTGRGRSKRAPSISSASHLTRRPSWQPSGRFCGGRQQREGYND